MNRTILAFALLGSLGVGLTARADCADDGTCSTYDETDAANDLYDATKSDPIVDGIERTIPGDNGNTMDEDFVDSGGTLGGSGELWTDDTSSDESSSDDSSSDESSDDSSADYDSGEDYSEDSTE